MKKVNKFLIAVMTALLTLTGCANEKSVESVNETAAATTSEIGTDVRADDSPVLENDTESKEEDLPETDDTPTEYDQILLEFASMITSEIGFDRKMDNPFITGSRYFDVIKTEEGYRIDVNGVERRIQIPSHTYSTYEPKEISDVTEKHQEVISQSKELVYQYIYSSKVLKDKDELKEYIDKIAFKEAYYTDDENVGAYFSHEENTLYINKYASDAVCEWMIVHELVHAISYYTHDMEIEKETYAFDLFNEVITDLVTATMKPKIVNNALSGYSLYYDLLSPYLNLFGIESIEAYYYGYDSIYKKIGKDEFDFFVLVIQNYGAEDTEAFYNNLMYKWYSKLN